jgi:HECT-domain (ubiquitin-transferase)/UBA/TS-N domain
VSIQNDIESPASTFKHATTQFSSLNSLFTDKVKDIQSMAASNEVHTELQSISAAMYVVLFRALSIQLAIKGAYIHPVPVEDECVPDCKNRSDVKGASGPDDHKHDVDRGFEFCASILSEISSSLVSIELWRTSNRSISPELCRQVIAASPVVPTLSLITAAILGLSSTIRSGTSGVATQAYECVKHLECVSSTLSSLVTMSSVQSHLKSTSDMDSKDGLECDDKGGGDGDGDRDGDEGDDTEDNDVMALAIAMSLGSDVAGAVDETDNFKHRIITLLQPSLGISAVALGRIVWLIPGHGKLLKYENASCYYQDQLWKTLRSSDKSSPRNISTIAFDMIGIAAAYCSAFVLQPRQLPNEVGVNIATAMQQLCGGLMESSDSSNRYDATMAQLQHGKCLPVVHVTSVSEYADAVARSIQSNNASIPSPSDRDVTGSFFNCLDAAHAVVFRSMPALRMSVLAHRFRANQPSFRTSTNSHTDLLAVFDILVATLVHHSGLYEELQVLAATKASRVSSGSVRSGTVATIYKRVSTAVSNLHRSYQIDASDDHADTRRKIAVLLRNCGFLLRMKPVQASWHIMQHASNYADEKMPCSPNSTPHGIPDVQCIVDATIGFALAATNEDLDMISDLVADSTDLIDAKIAVLEFVKRHTMCVTQHRMTQCMLAVLTQANVQIHQCSCARTYHDLPPCGTSQGIFDLYRTMTATIVQVCKTLSVCASRSASGSPSHVLSSGPMILNALVGALCFVPVPSTFTNIALEHVVPVLSRVYSSQLSDDKPHTQLSEMAAHTQNYWIVATLVNGCSVNNHNYTGAAMHNQRLHLIQRIVDELTSAVQSIRKTIQNPTSDEADCHIAWLRLRPVLWRVCAIADQSTYVAFITSIIDSHFIQDLMLVLLCAPSWGKLLASHIMGLLLPSAVSICASIAFAPPSTLATPATAIASLDPGIESGDIFDGCGGVVQLLLRVCGAAALMNFSPHMGIDETTTHGPSCKHALHRFSCVLSHPLQLLAHKLTEVLRALCLHESWSATLSTTFQAILTDDCFLDSAVAEMVDQPDSASTPTLLLAGALSVLGGYAPVVGIGSYVVTGTASAASVVTGIVRSTHHNSNSSKPDICVATQSHEYHIADIDQVRPVYLHSAADTIIQALQLKLKTPTAVLAAIHSIVMSLDSALCALITPAHPRSGSTLTLLYMTRALSVRALAIFVSNVQLSSVIVERVLLATLLRVASKPMPIKVRGSQTDEAFLAHNAARAVVHSQASITAVQLQQALRECTAFLCDGRIASDEWDDVLADTFCAESKSNMAQGNSGSVSMQDLEYYHPVSIVHADGRSKSTSEIQAEVADHHQRASASSASSGIGGSSPINVNSQVQQLMGMGFPQLMCERAYELSGHNVNVAISMLLEQPEALIGGISESQQQLDISSTASKDAAPHEWGESEGSPVFHPNDCEVYVEYDSFGNALPSAASSHYRCEPLHSHKQQQKLAESLVERYSDISTAQNATTLHGASTSWLLGTATKYVSCDIPLLRTIGLLRNKAQGNLAEHSPSDKFSLLPVIESMTIVTARNAVFALTQSTVPMNLLPSVRQALKLDAVQGMHTEDVKTASSTTLLDRLRSTWVCDSSANATSTVELVRLLIKLIQLTSPKNAFCMELSLQHDSARNPMLFMDQQYAAVNRCSSPSLSVATLARVSALSRKSQLWHTLEWLMLVERSESEQASCIALLADQVCRFLRLQSRAMRTVQSEHPVRRVLGQSYDGPIPDYIHEQSSKFTTRAADRVLEVTINVPGAEALLVELDPMSLLSDSSAQLKLEIPSAPHQAHSDMVDAPGYVGDVSTPVGAAGRGLVVSGPSLVVNMRRSDLAPATSNPNTVDSPEWGFRMRVTVDSWKYEFEESLLQVPCGVSALRMFARYTSVNDSSSVCLAQTEHIVSLGIPSWLCLGCDAGLVDFLCAPQMASISRTSSQPYSAESKVLAPCHVAQLSRALLNCSEMDRVLHDTLRFARCPSVRNREVCLDFASALLLGRASDLTASTTSTPPQSDQKSLSLVGSIDLASHVPAIHALISDVEPVMRANADDIAALYFSKGNASGIEFASAYTRLHETQRAAESGHGHIACPLGISWLADVEDIPYLPLALKQQVSHADDGHSMSTLQLLSGIQPSKSRLWDVLRLSHVLECLDTGESVPLSLQRSAVEAVQDTALFKWTIKLFEFHLVSAARNSWWTRERRLRWLAELDSCGDSISSLYFQILKLYDSLVMQAHEGKWSRYKSTWMTSLRAANCISDLARAVLDLEKYLIPPCTLDVWRNTSRRRSWRKGLKMMRDYAYNPNLGVEWSLQPISVLWADSEPDRKSRASNMLRSDTSTYRSGKAENANVCLGLNPVRFHATRTHSESKQVVGAMRSPILGGPTSDSASVSPGSVSSPVSAPALSLSSATSSEPPPESPVAQAPAAAALPALASMIGEFGSALFSSVLGVGGMHNDSSGASADAKQSGSIDNGDSGAGNDDAKLITAPQRRRSSTRRSSRSSSSQRRHRPSFHAADNDHESDVHGQTSHTSKSLRATALNQDNGPQFVIERIILRPPPSRSSHPCAFGLVFAYNSRPEPLDGKSTPLFDYFTPRLYRKWLQTKRESGAPIYEGEPCAAFSLLGPNQEVPVDVDFRVIARYVVVKLIASRSTLEQRMLHGLDVDDNGRFISLDQLEDDTGMYSWAAQTSTQQIKLDATANRSLNAAFAEFSAGAVNGPNAPANTLSIRFNNSNWNVDFSSMMASSASEQCLLLYQPASSSQDSGAIELEYFAIAGASDPQQVNAMRSAESVCEIGPDPTLVTSEVPASDSKSKEQKHVAHPQADGTNASDVVGAAITKELASMDLAHTSSKWSKSADRELARLLNAASKRRGRGISALTLYDVWPSWPDTDAKCTGSDIAGPGGTESDELSSIVLARTHSEDASFSMPVRSIDRSKLVSLESIKDYPELSKMGLNDIRARFALHRLLNMSMPSLLAAVGCDGSLSHMPGSISNLLRRSRSVLSLETKMRVWQDVWAMLYSRERSSVAVTLNRQRALRLIKNSILSGTVESDDDNANSYAAKEPKADDNTNSPDQKLEFSHTMYRQLMDQLQHVPARWLRRADGIAWFTKFVGEAAIDDGGLYRESISNICSELQRTHSKLPILRQTPNARSAMGDYQEAYVPIPLPVRPTSTSTFDHENRRSERCLWFLGRLMGVVGGRDLESVIGLDFSPLVWKVLADESCSLQDVEQIDCMLQHERSAAVAGALDDDELLYVSSSVPDAADQLATIALAPRLINDSVRPKIDRAKLRTLHDALFDLYRLHEFDHSIAAIRHGLCDVVPYRLLPLLTSDDLRLVLTGTGDIDLKLLARRTKTEDGYSNDDPAIKYLWRTLYGFTPLQRQAFLKFVWGRTRLPYSEQDFQDNFFRIVPLIPSGSEKHPDKFLPRSHTCFFSLELPRYSSAEVLRERLMYAISHAHTIDDEEAGDNMQQWDLGNN